MLSIRLQRVGRSKQAYFRLILQEKTANPKSKNLELLGSYDPRTKVYVLKEDRIKYWLSQGAKATNTVHNMLIDKGILTGAKKKTASIVKPEVVAAEAAPVVAEATPANIETIPTETAPASPNLGEPVVEAAPVTAEVAAEKPAEVVTETKIEETPAPETPAV
ncbi:MAG: 30S ribosomal protein S16 [Patescibacteria group bacterium]|nr:30S ribosomal protein S16 [Patescibacteria group bacterium]